MVKGLCLHSLIDIGQVCLDKCIELVSKSKTFEIFFFQNVKFFKMHCHTGAGSYRLLNQICMFTFYTCMYLPLDLHLLHLGLLCVKLNQTGPVEEISKSHTPAINIYVLSRNGKALSLTIYQFNQGWYKLSLNFDKWSSLKLLDPVC